LLPQVSALLKKSSPSEHEQRVVASIRWAGRAVVEQRRELAFLYFAISLETLLIARKSVGIVNEIATRAAWLIGDTAPDRLKVARQVRDLYDKRSQVAHSGAMEITDSELGEIRWLARQAILLVLEGHEFPSISTAADFEKWIGAKTLGA
jgi:hypothetical protein